MKNKTFKEKQTKNQHKKDTIALYLTLLLTIVLYNILNNLCLMYL